MSLQNDQSGSLLGAPLPSLNDEEGYWVPDGLPFLVDAHVHLFPAELFKAIWQWFAQFGWPIRYQMKSDILIRFLLSKGIDHIVALQYAHKPGAARELNRYMSGICGRYREVTGMATVFPGEPDSGDILKEAFDMGLSGVKLHSHVQCFDMDSDGMHVIYGICSDFQKPLIMHVGREPKSPAYACDPYEFCRADKLEKVIKSYPSLRVCVPHLGMDEFETYGHLIEKYDNLWLDTTMTLAEYLPMDFFPQLEKMRLERIMFGTDFPNIPYAWDRELKRLIKEKLPEMSMERILGLNAVEFYALPKEK
jgi:predicted TIM-barrel fold metal-dependent hydrolase